MRVVRLSSRDAEPVLQRLDVVADHGDGHVQPPGRGGEAAVFDDAAEHREAGQPVHARPGLSARGLMILPMIRRLSQSPRQAHLSGHATGTSDGARQDRRIRWARCPRFRPMRQAIDDRAPPRRRRRPAVAAAFVRRASLIGSALLAGTAAGRHYGYDYWTDRPLPGLHRRRLREGRLHHRRAEGVRLSRRGAGAGQPAGQGRRRSWPGSTTATSARPSTRPRPMSPPRRPPCRTSTRRSACRRPRSPRPRPPSTATQASLSFAEADAARYRDLATTGSGTVQRAQQTQAARDQIAAQLQRDQAAVLAAQRKVAVLVTAARPGRGPAPSTPGPSPRQAELNLGYTTITAADRRHGRRPHACGSGSMSRRAPSSWRSCRCDAAYVVANYKETQLAHVRAGQPVESRSTACRA